MKTNKWTAAPDYPYEMDISGAPVLAVKGTL